MVRIAGAGTWDAGWVKTVFERNPGKVDSYSVHRYLVNDRTIWQAQVSIIQLFNTISHKSGLWSPDFIKSFDQAMNNYDPGRNSG